MNWRTKRIHPLEIIFGDKFPLVIDCFPLGFIFKDDSSSRIIETGCKSIFKPANHFYSTLMRLSNKYLQRIKLILGINFDKRVLLKQRLIDGRKVYHEMIPYSEIYCIYTNGWTSINSIDDACLWLRGHGSRNREPYSFHNSLACEWMNEDDEDIADHFYK